MAKQKNLEYKRNQEMTTSSSFLESFNKGMPVAFLQATENDLKRFQEAHPMLFKHSNAWSIDKHRKKLMDWLPSHRNES